MTVRLEERVGVPAQREGLGPGRRQEGCQRIGDEGRSHRQRRPRKRHRRHRQARYARLLGQRLPIHTGGGDRALHGHMQNAPLPGEILGQLDRPDAARQQLARPFVQHRDHALGPRRQHAGPGGAADAVRALVDEPDPAVAGVQARAHPVAGLGRRRDRRRLRQLDASDAAEGVPNDLRLQGELPWVRDVGQRPAPAGGGDVDGAPIRRRAHHVESAGENRAAARPFNRRAYLLAGNGPRDEDHAPLPARDHPAADRRPLDGQLDGVGAIRNGLARWVHCRPAPGRGAVC